MTACRRQPVYYERLAETIREGHANVYKHSFRVGGFETYRDFLSM